jgi:hypothetical protein
LYRRVQQFLFIFSHVIDGFERGVSLIVGKAKSRLWQNCLMQGHMVTMH